MCGGFTSTSFTKISFVSKEIKEYPELAQKTKINIDHEILSDYNNFCNSIYNQAEFFEKFKCSYEVFPHEQVKITLC